MQQSGLSDVELFDYMNNLIQNLSSTSNTSGSSSSTTLSIDLIHINDSANNCSEYIKEKLKWNLLSNLNHKLYEMKIKLESILQSELHKLGMTPVNIQQYDLPLVTIQQNFDNLLIPLHHYSRRPSDVYYVNNDIILRTHLTAYLYEIFHTNPSLTSYFLCGPVYRRIEEDNFHSELSHQVIEDFFALI